MFGAFYPYLSPFSPPFYKLSNHISIIPYLLILFRTWWICSNLSRKDSRLSKLIQVKNRVWCGGNFQSLNTYSLSFDSNWWLFEFVHQKSSNLVFKIWSLQYIFNYQVKVENKHYTIHIHNSYFIVKNEVLKGKSLSNNYFA